jgi:hypothetical protein
MKPVGLVATATEQTGKALGAAMSGDMETAMNSMADVPQKYADILTGKTTRSFSYIWRENLPENPVAGTIIGTIIDIAADPLNFVGGGLTKAGKLAEQLTKLTKAGETVAEGSKLASKIEKAGMTAKDLELGVTKAEQAAKGQRAFLKIGDTALLPAKTSEAIYKATGKAGDAIKSIPAVGSAIDKTKAVFSTATKNPAFDALENKMTNLLNYRKAKVIEDAKFIQNAMKGMKPDEVIQVSNYLEKGTVPTIPVLKDIGDKLKVTYKNYSDIEKSLGLAETDILNYIPHIKTKEGQQAVELFTPKPWSARLGAAEPRTILKFVDDSGKGIIGTADSLKLTKVKDIKKGSDIIGSLYRDAAGKQYKVGAGVGQASIEEINRAINKKLFHENPAVQLAYRGTANAKAVTSQEFFEGAKKFASEMGGVETRIPELKGLKFEPEIAKHIETYYKSMNPEEIRGVLRVFDAVQNWWKGQALISPAYHIRNAVGNLWNNFLAGVNNPTSYIDAGKIQLGKNIDFVDDIGRNWTGKQVLEEAKKNGVLNQGWYAGDIEKEITGEMGKANFNPLSQNNIVFKGNQKVGSVVENNARLANFIQQLKKGLPVEDAALEVKKYLFDYTDLTWNEKNVLKRAMPFYTFTRKNVPLQLQNLITQPGKYSGLEKVVQAAENIGMGEDNPANEKYLSDYIKSNTAMRVNFNKDTKSYNYFLLGNWLPAYQAMDFLSQPLPNMMAMLTPIIKTPIETLTNTSSFWRNTMEEYQNIERYPGEQVNYLGFNMPKKTAQVLRNIRLLNDLDKLNPGLIFGGKRGEKSVFAKANLPAISVPLAGNISPAQYKYSATAVKPTAVERGAGFLSSKLVNYKPAYSREFYNQDTDTRVQEYKTSIKKAARTGDKARVKLLTKQMNEFRKERGN